MYSFFSYPPNHSSFSAAILNYFHYYLLFAHTKILLIAVCAHKINNQSNFALIYVKL